MWWKLNHSYSAHVGLLMAKCNVTTITGMEDRKTHNGHNNGSSDSDEKDDNNTKFKRGNKTDEINSTDSISTAGIVNSTSNPLNSSSGVMIFSTVFGDGNSAKNLDYSGPYSFNTGPFVFNSMPLPNAFPQYPSNNPFANSVWFGPKVRCPRPKGSQAGDSGMYPCKYIWHTMILSICKNTKCHHKVSPSKYKFVGNFLITTFYSTFMGILLKKEPFKKGFMAFASGPSRFSTDRERV